MSMRRSGVVSDDALTREGQASASPAIGDQSQRTARTLRLGERSAPATFQRPDSVADDQSAQTGTPPAARSDASIRSEIAAANYAATKDMRRSVRARDTIANDLNEALHARQVRGEESYSNVAFGRACDVDEKTVAKWRSDEKPLPAWALSLMPHDLYRETLASVEAARHGKIERRELPNLRPLLSKLDVQLAQEDPAVALRELGAAARQLAGMIERLMWVRRP